MYSKQNLYNLLDTNLIYIVAVVDKAAVRSDAAAELDRLTRNKKSSSPPGSPDSSANNSLEQPPSSSEC
jgi:hypothetical protein